MKKDFDILGVLVGVIIGVLIGYLIGSKLDIDGNANEKEVISETEIEYIYLLQVAKFDNASGANNYQMALNNKELETIVVFDKTYYYVYGGIAKDEAGLSDLKNKYYILGYDTIVKKELLIDKANSIIDNANLYAFYNECIHNLYLSLSNEAFTISEKYYIDPIDIEIFSQFTILISVKNEELKQKAQLQAYKLISEDLS